MLAHQVGAFLDVWLGGVAVEMTGSYDAFWLADIALALVASAAHLAIRENRVTPVGVPIQTDNNPSGARHLADTRRA
jgi:hypothetical protein